NDMKNDISQAQNHLTATLQRADDEDLAKAITEREARLKPELDGLARAYPQCARMVNLGDRAIGTPLAPATYYDRHLCSFKVDLLWRFDQKKRQITGDARARLKNHLPLLMKYLVADT